ncbi:MAG: hypothetical protein JO222_04245 [Frankiales bacterium]|nr:hypothetical protein [Frankiales bacterium]
MSQYDVTSTALSPQLVMSSAVSRLVDQLMEHCQANGLPVSESMCTSEAMTLPVAAITFVALSDDLGYAVRALPQPDQSVLLWAERGHELLVAQVHGDGRVELDNAGVANGACRERVDALQTACSGRGLSMSSARRVAHGDPRGGALIRRAAATESQGQAAETSQATLSLRQRLGGAS